MIKDNFMTYKLRPSMYVVHVELKGWMVVLVGSGVIINTQPVHVAKGH